MSVSHSTYTNITDRSISTISYVIKAIKKDNRDDALQRKKLMIQCKKKDFILKRWKKHSIKNYEN